MRSGQFKIFFILLNLAMFSYSCISQERYVLKCKKELLEASFDTLLAQVGIIEKSGKNDGEVVKYNQILGLPKNAPYCAAGQYYCFFVSAKSLKLDVNEIPIKRTGVANEIFIDARKKGKKTSLQLQKHDLIVWKKLKSWAGHIERVIKVGTGGWCQTVGFNTKGFDTRINREGNGVFIKKRNLFHFNSRMIIRGVVGFE